MLKTPRSKPCTHNVCSKEWCCYQNYSELFTPSLHSLHLNVFALMLLHFTSTPYLNLLTINKKVLLWKEKAKSRSYEICLWFIFYVLWVLFQLIRKLFVLVQWSVWHVKYDKWGFLGGKKQIYQCWSLQYQWSFGRNSIQIWQKKICSRGEALI